jgi:hypothetical protein
MTDYDLISLYHESAALQNDILINYIYVIFAFLVTGYLVADKLNLLMSILVIILFTAISGFFLIDLNYLHSDMRVLTNEMALRALSNEFVLPDLGMVQITDGVSLFGLSLRLAIYGSYIGALIFYFYQRAQGLKTL